MNIVSTTVDEIKTNPVVLKQLKRLSRAVTGEQLKIFSGDLVFMTKYNNKIIGMCCIAMLSPESHFLNEIDKKVPYLYNYMCDYSHSKKKPSVFIMNHIKNFISTGSYVNEINLDVLVDNTHAQKFFEKNNFNIRGEYKKGTNAYNMYTFIGLETPL